MSSDDRCDSGCSSSTGSVEVNLCDLRATQKKSRSCPRLLIPRETTRDLLEHVREAACLAPLPCATVIGVRADQWHDGRRFSEHHLLIGGLDLAPGVGFLEGRGRARAI